MVSDSPLPHVDGVAHRFADVGGTQIHYAEAGTGEPLVLVHGWPQHWWAWREVIAPLAERYRVICPDIRGMGWSEGSRADYSFQRLARELLDFVDALGIETFRLVGHDWGLVIGFRAVFNWPERVTQFVALGGVHFWSRDGGPLGLWAAPWHIYLIALLGDVASRRLGVTERCLRVWRHAGRFSASELEIYMGVMLQPRCLEATRRFDRNVVLREVPHYLLHASSTRTRTPILLLNGDHDPLTQGVPHSYRHYADRMRLELVPDCGHFIAEEQPEWLVARLREFFD